MIHLDLFRRWFDPDRTLGELWIHGAEFVAYTLEPGWLDKEYPHVEPGEYRLVPHNGPRFQNTWALVGDGVAHYPTPGVARSTVLFHSGNTDDETKGCILLGTSIGRVKGETGVLSSVAAMSRLRQIIGTQSAVLTIWDE
jgi:hypothetical protein